MTRFQEIVATQPLIITEGAVIERLRREFPAYLDPNIANAGCIYQPKLKSLLSAIYRHYIDAVRPAGLPMILFTPTWRANEERLKLAGYARQDVNGDCVRLMHSIRDEYDDYSPRVFIGGLMGCKGNAYKAAEALGTGEAHSFHRVQVEALARAGPDFLMGATLPAASEALGLAHAMADSGLPYILSFIIRPDGALLDGLTLNNALAMIDGATSPMPLGYMINCVHPANFRMAYTKFSGDTKRRLLGLQANTSRKSPEELDESGELDSENPTTFADQMISLHREFGLKILGGCCGTDQRHIAAMVAHLR